MDICFLGRDAQWRPCKLEAAPLEEVAGWVEDYRRFWAESFDRLDIYLAKVQAEGKKGKNRRRPNPAVSA